MRSMVLAISAVVTVIGHAQSKPSRSMPADVGPGRVAWFDITTSSLPKSKEFYGKLFDWTFAPVQGSDLTAEIVANDASIGTLRVAEGQISAANGVVYVQVVDIRASCKKAEALGGTIVPGFPFDLSNGTGAIALMIDPAGHPIGMYSRTLLASEKGSAR
jgi:predicted enzyme related to lactoylglutathione lyase